VITKKSKHQLDWIKSKQQSYQFLARAPIEDGFHFSGAVNNNHVTAFIAIAMKLSKTFIPF
jgi:hypothetical protein